MNSASISSVIMVAQIPFETGVPIYEQVAGERFGAQSPKARQRPGNVYLPHEIWQPYCR